MDMRLSNVLAGLVAASCVFPLCGCGRQPAGQPSPQPSTPVMASFDGFQFEIPVGWSRVQPDQKKTMAMLLLNGNTWNTADGMLKVDAGKPSLPTAEATARAIAGSDGKVFPDPVSVDGEKGIRLETTSTNLEKPRHAVVIYRGGRVYLIMAAGIRGVDVENAFNHVLKTWRWATTP